MDQVTIDKLYEEFDIAIKPGQGYKYVRTRDILDRLNKTFEGNWGVQVKHHELIGDEVLVLVSVNLYDEDGHVKATQEGFGSAKKYDRTEIGNTYKSATSKAVKSAVRNWGVALFLEEDNVNTQGAQTGRINTSTHNTTNGPSSMPSTPPQNGGMPSTPPSGPPSTPSTQSTPPSGPPSTQSTPPSGPPSTQSTPPAGNTPPSSTPEGMSTPAPSGHVPPPPSGTPPANTGATPPNSGGLPSMSAVPGSAPVGATAGNDTHSITAVQKVAITSRLGAKGLTFDQISEEFYTGKTTQAPESIDGMLYVDALDMVAFLNTK